MEKDKAMAYKAKLAGDVINCEMAYRIWQFEKSAAQWLMDQEDIPDTVGDNEIIVIEADLMIGLISGAVLGDPKCSIMDIDHFVDIINVYRQNNINMNLLAAMNQYNRKHLNDIFSYKSLWFTKKKSGPIVRVSYIMKFYGGDDAIYKYLDKDGGISNTPELNSDDADTFTLMAETFTRAMKEPDICREFNRELEKEENLRYNPDTDDFEDVSAGDSFSDFISGIFGMGTNDSDDDDNFHM